MVRLASVWLICFPLSLTCATPAISPPGFNASEDAEAVVVFKCFATHFTSGSADIRWLINGTATSGVVLENRGIFLDETVRTEDETAYIEVSILPTAENDGTSLQCRVIFANDTIVRSSEVLFRVQGPLSPPTSLSTVWLNSTHDYLVWEDPPTLDLTDHDPDITGYTVSLLMKKPPMGYTEEYAMSLTQLGIYTEQTFLVNSTSGRQFPVLRYGFPVQFRVSAWNPAGQGEASQYHVIEPPNGCVRIKDAVQSEATSKVTLNGSHLSLEIVAFQLQQQEHIVGYCFDYLVVEIRDSHDGSLSSRHVLLPTVKEDRTVSLKVESCLESVGHFTALVYFNSSLVTQTNLSTFNVQDVLISTLPNGLAVECLFAEGSATNTCSVVLLLEGELVVKEEIDSQTTFFELRSGHYTVLVYDSSVSTSGSGEPLPAVERTVTLTGATHITSHVPVPTSSLERPTDQPIYIIAIPIAAILVAVLLVLVLMGVIVALKRVIKTRVPTATNMAYDTVHSPTATDTHAAYEMIPVPPSSIPTASNVAYAVPLQPDPSPLQPATAHSCALYDTVDQDSSPLYDIVH